MASAVCFFRLRRALPLSLPVGKYLLRPAAYAAAMGIAAKIGYWWLHQCAGSNTAALLAVLLAPALYAALILVCKGVTAEDLRA